MTSSNINYSQTISNYNNIKKVSASGRSAISH